MSNAVSLAVFAFILPVLMVFARLPGETRWLAPVRYMVAVMSAFFAVALAAGEGMDSPVSVPFFLLLTGGWISALGIVRAVFIWVEPSDKPRAY